jgi:hypothetical protein
MQRLTLATLALIILGCAPCAAAPREAGEVPFTFEKGYVIVAAKVKGKEPVEVVVSTGAEYSSVDTGMLDKYKLQAYYTGVGPITGFNDRTISYAKVPDVRVGPADASLDMVLGSTAHVTRAIGRTIFGVLGSDFFKGRTVQFDFTKRVMRFLDKAAAEAVRAKGAAGAPGTAVVQMVVSGNPYKQHLTVPLVEKVTFNGKSAKLLLDTGLATAVAFTSSAAKKLGFEAPPEKGAPRADTIGSLRVGAYEVAGVPVMVFAKGSGADERLGEGGAAAGSVFLQNFVATFDFRGRVVILEHV